MTHFREVYNKLIWQNKLISGSLEVTERLLALRGDFLRNGDSIPGEHQGKANKQPFGQVYEIRTLSGEDDFAFSLVDFIHIQRAVYIQAIQPEYERAIRALADLFS